MNEVYVVESGTHYEGGGVLAVYSSYESAVAHCRKYANDKSAPMVEFVRSEGRNGDDRWDVVEMPADDALLCLHWGCYYATVRRVEVQP